MAIRFRIFLNSPTGMFLSIGMVVIGVEVLIMQVIDRIASVTMLPPGLLDPLLLAAVTAPILYLFVLRPIRSQRISLHQREYELGVLLANVPDLVWFKDCNSRYLWVNSAFEKVSGKTSASLKGKTDNEIWEPDEAVGCQSDDQRALSTRTTLSREKTLTLRGGEPRVYFSSRTPMYSTDGSCAGILCVGHDVTERKRAEDGLRAALRELEFQKIALDRHAIVSATDAAGNITYANDKFCQVSQYPREELTGRNHRILKSGMHPPEVYADMWETISSGHIWQGEICNRKKDGTLYWVQTTITPFLDENGLPYQYVGMRTEITKIKEAEAVLARGKEELEALVRKRTGELAMSNAELEAEIEDRMQAETRLREMNLGLRTQMAVAATLEVPGTLEDRLGLVLETMLSVDELNGRGRGIIFLANKEKDYLDLFVSRGHFSDAFLEKEKHVPVSECPCRQAFASGNVIRSEKCPSDLYYGDAPPGEEGQGCYSMPLKFENETKGVLFLHTRSHLHWDDGVARQIGFMLGAAIQRDEADTQIRSQAEALRESEEIFRSITSAAQDGIVMNDGDGNISYWNQAAEKIFSYSATEAMGLNLHKLLAPTRYLDSHEKAFANFVESGHGNLVGKTTEVEAVRKDGTEIPIELSLSAVKIKGKWNGVGIVRDITERKRSLEMLQKMATTDTLTGIFNRRKFNSALEDEIKRVERYPAPMSLILFDIDHFKLINDTFGHQAGDSVLAQLAKLVSKKTRAQDVFARWGGEEFVILAPGSSLENTAQLAEKLRDAVAKWNFNKVGKVTCSFGVTEFRSGENADALTKRVDDALYRAKKNGRNRVEVE